jgi:hypothetical protein
LRMSYFARSVPEDFLGAAGFFGAGGMYRSFYRVPNSHSGASGSNSRVSSLCIKA